MKKLLLSLALVTGLALASNAQNEKEKLTPEAHAKQGAEWASKKLELDAVQQRKWYDAALARINANAPLREKLKGSTTPDERKSIHKEMHNNMETFDTAVNGFLTADQKTKWEQIKAEKKAKHQAKKDAKKGEPEIDLDPEK